MTVETLMDLIKKHNDVVKFWDTVEDLSVPVGVIFRLMPLSSKIASLGLALTHEARQTGINAKCRMPGGEIIIYPEKMPKQENFQRR